MFGTVDKFIGSAVVLIAVFLVLSRSKDFDIAMSSIADSFSGLFGTLQGRSVKFQGGTQIGGIA